MLLVSEEAELLSDVFFLPQGHPGKEGPAGEKGAQVGVLPHSTFIKTGQKNQNVQPLSLGHRGHG